MNIPIICEYWYLRKWVWHAYENSAGRNVDTSGVLLMEVCTCCSEFVECRMSGSRNGVKMACYIFYQVGEVV